MFSHLLNFQRLIISQLFGGYSDSYLFFHCSIDCCEDYISPLGDVSGNVLGINVDPADKYGNKIQLQPKNESSSDGQKWVREQDVGNGWFPLKNPNSGKILSALNESSLVARGKYKSVMWWRVNPKILGGGGADSIHWLGDQLSFLTGSYY